MDVAMKTLIIAFAVWLCGASAAASRGAVHSPYIVAADAIARQKALVLSPGHHDIATSLAGAAK